MFVGLTLSAPLVRAEAVDPDYIVDREDYSPDHPWYQTAKSTWSMGVRVGLNGFPSSAANGNLYQFNFDWVIPFQKIGVFSIGSDLGILQLRTANSAVDTSQISNGVAGAHLRYQLKLFPVQPLVPTASIGVDYYRLKSNLPAASYATEAQVNTTFGLLFNLGWIDGHTAKEAFQSSGMTKTYILAELNMRKFANPVFSLDGKFYLLGVRVEFK